GPDDDAGAFTAEECAKRRIKANYIYTRIPSARKISGIPHKEVWTPAQTWEDGQDILVRSLAGPTAGLKFLVQDALPYTLEAAVACRRQGQNVVGYDGKLFLQDKEIKPLAEHLPGTLPLPSVRLPSPAVLVARPAPLFPSQKLRNTPLFKHGDPDECTKYDRLGFLNREAMLSPTSVAVLTVLWRKLPWSPSDAEELVTASVGATASEDTSALYQKVQKSLFGDNPIPRSELAIMTIHRVLKYEFLMAGLITPETLSLATQLSLMPPEFEIYLKLEKWFIAPQAQYLLSLLAATKDPALVTSTTDPATGAEDTRTRPGHTSDKPMDIDDTANQTDNLVSSGSGIHKSAICMESTTFISPFNSNSSNSSGESSSASTAPTDISADSKSSTTSKVILPVEAADHNDGEDSEDDVEEDVMEPAFDGVGVSGMGHQVGHSGFPLLRESATPPSCIIGHQRSGQSAHREALDSREQRAHEGRMRGDRRAIRSFTAQ
ncbi:hypothetical protein B0H10DRAFT_2242414, partial [Mycena sp. CBHHK59/15]